MRRCTKGYGGLVYSSDEEGRGSNAAAAAAAPSSSSRKASGLTMLEGHPSSTANVDKSRYIAGVETTTEL